MTEILTPETIPDDMSLVIGWWALRIQESRPDAFHASQKWRKLLTQAARTGRGDETTRCNVVVSWMWDQLGDEALLRALSPSLLPSWRLMLDVRTGHAARDADRICFRPVVPAAATGVERTVSSITFHAKSVGVVTPENAAGMAVSAALAVCQAAKTIGYAASDTIDPGPYDACAAAYAEAHDAFWRRADPFALLAALIDVS